MVEDEAKMADLIRRALVRDGYAVDLAADGAEALWAVAECEYDAVVLDAMIPAPDGFDVCRQLRKDGRWNPVLMLTARDGVADRVRGLDAGADDYLTKPFSPRELVARIRAMLRRPRAAPSGHAAAGPVRRLGELVIDPAAREVRLKGRPVELTRLEFDLLEALSERPRMVLSRRALLERVWGPDWYGDDPRAPLHILTVRGIGYRMGRAT